MGCMQSVPLQKDSDEYIETLTLKRTVSKKPAGQNLQIQISVIADPLSSDEEAGELQYKIQKAKTYTKNSRIKTMSFAEGRRFTKFPNMVGYKMCLSCNEPGKDVLKTVAPDIKKELCRKCSVHHRKESQKRGKATKKYEVEATPGVEKQTSEQLTNASSSSDLRETVKKMEIATLASLLALVRFLAGIQMLSLSFNICENQNLCASFKLVTKTCYLLSGLSLSVRK